MWSILKYLSNPVNSIILHTESTMKILEETQKTTNSDTSYSYDQDVERFIFESSKNSATLGIASTVSIRFLFLGSKEECPITSLTTAVTARYQLSHAYFFVNMCYFQNRKLMREKLSTSQKVNLRRSKFSFFHFDSLTSLGSVYLASSLFDSRSESLKLPAQVPTSDHFLAPIFSRLLAFKRIWHALHLKQI